MLLQQQEGRGARRGGDHPAVLWSWKGMLLQQQEGKGARREGGDQRGWTGHTYIYVEKSVTIWQ